MCGDRLGRTLYRGPEPNGRPSPDSAKDIDVKPERGRSGKGYPGGIGTRAGGGWMVIGEGIPWAVHVPDGPSFVKPVGDVNMKPTYESKIPLRASLRVPQANRLPESFETQDHFGDRQLARWGIVLEGFFLVQGQAAQPPFAHAPASLIDLPRSSRRPRSLPATAPKFARVAVRQGADTSQHFAIHQPGIVVKDCENGRLDVLKNVRVFLFNLHPGPTSYLRRQSRP